MYYFVLISHYAHPVWSPSPSTGEGWGEGLFSPSTGEMPFRAERVSSPPLRGRAGERVYSLIIVNCPFAFILMMLLGLCFSRLCRLYFTT